MIICVTGPMAAGKNTVTGFLGESGWKSVDADELVHDAVGHVAPQILAAFSGEAERAGITLLHNDGTLDRRALGSLIFGSPVLLARQESIVYPEVNRMTDLFISSCGADSVIINATVLYKIPCLMAKCSAVLYVTAPWFVRFFRAKMRDGLPLRQICARFRSQRNLYRSYAATGIPVIRIRNTCSRSALRRKTARAASQIAKNT